VIQIKEERSPTGAASFDVNVSQPDMVVPQWQFACFSHLCALFFSTCASEIQDYMLWPLPGSNDTPFLAFLKI
jgi:hypothetical protein